MQIETFKHIQLLRHGAPKTIQCDREYDNQEFRAFCESHDISLRFSAAHDHEANGLFENANRTLRSFFDRLRLCDKRSPATLIVAEACYGKNISLGAN